MANNDDKIIFASEIIRLGKDEMNLIEHPFGSLSKEKDTRVIELRWKAQHPISKKVVDAYWKVSGDQELGLPTANDERVYLVAIELTREANWSRQVHFTRLDFINRLGWAVNAQNYDRLFEAFKRLSSVTIFAQNAFYHAKSGYLYNGAFHLFDTFIIEGEGPGRKSAQRLEGPVSYFMWNEVVHRSFLAGNIRSLDLDFALSLDRPLALRLFRYLDKKRHGGRDTFEVSLRELCGVHLGMIVDGRYDSHLRATLDPAHSELLNRGFLADASYEKMKSRQGTKIVYRFAVPSAQPADAETAEGAVETAPSTPDFGTFLDELDLQAPAATTQGSLFGALMSPSQPTPNTSPGTPQSQNPPAAPLRHQTPKSAVPASPAEPSLEAASIEPAVGVSAPSTDAARGDLVERLKARGVSASVAQELAAKFPGENVALQLDCLDDREPKNPAAALVKSIRQGWNPPGAFLDRVEAQERAQQAQMDNEAIRAQEAAQGALERERRASQDREAQQLDAMWDKLDLKTRERIEAEAQQRLGMLGRLGKAHAALDAMRRNVMREIIAAPDADS